MHEVLERCTIARVQSWDSEAIVPTALERAFGVMWPRVVGLVAVGRADVVCVGPTDWLVMSVKPDDTMFLMTINGAFAGTTFRATDVSSSLARIHLDGEYVRATLSKGCGLDLRPEVFLSDRSARTRLAGIPVIVRCRDPMPFELIVSLSYREYMLAWLADAALEFQGVAA
jgi:heterotetrameric sarcosine oxidase gamma subunit